MKRTSITALALLACLLAFGAVARAETFTVDCGPHDVPPGGLHVVGAVNTVYDPVEDDVDLASVLCFTAGGASTPVTPPDGVVGFCPSKDVPTTCRCHADVGPSETLGYCLQAPADAPEEATLTAFVLTTAGEVTTTYDPPGKRGRGHAYGHQK
jgi:putative hemolysin